MLHTKVAEVGPSLKMNAALAEGFGLSGPLTKVGSGGGVGTQTFVLPLSHVMLRVGMLGAVYPS
jgi:hypothetical protein